MTYASFLYSDEASGNWADHLRRIIDNGEVGVRSCVLWGAHEQLQGTCDFSRSSRLRLEKFLRLVEETGLELELCFGFPARHEALPAWALSANYLSTVVPTAAWKTDSDSLSLTRVPSLFDVDFQEAFFDFVDQAMGIISLYLKPEGPISRISIDPGIYEADLGAIDSPQYVEKLQHRYPTIAPFNTNYRTTFKDFTAATSPQGMRAICDKRPWLAAYDYKWCRAKMLTEFAEKLVQLPCMAPARSFLHFDSEVVAPLAAANWELAFDPVMLETAAGDRGYPFSPGGLLQPQAIGAFRLWEYLTRRANKANTPMQFLPPSPIRRNLQAKVAVIIAGKYLSRGSFRMIDEWAQEGGQAYFPLDFPQYDELLGSLDWRGATDRQQVKTHAGVFTRIRRGRGYLWVPTTFLEVRQDLWPQIQNACETILNPELA